MGLITIKSPNKPETETKQPEQKEVVKEVIKEVIVEIDMNLPIELDVMLTSDNKLVVFHDFNFFLKVE